MCRLNHIGPFSFMYINASLTITQENYFPWFMLFNTTSVTVKNMKFHLRHTKKYEISLTPLKFIPLICEFWLIKTSLGFGLITKIIDSYYMSPRMCVLMTRLYFEKKKLLNLLLPYSLLHWHCNILCPLVFSHSALGT